MSEAEEIRARAAGLWAFRAGAEAEAAARFGALAGALGRCGASPALVAAARKSAEDERRHLRDCAALAGTLGREVRLPEARVALPGSARLPERLRLAQAMVATCCVAETLSALLLDEMRRRSEHPEARSLVHTILRDEVDHARLGWAWAETDLDDAQRAHLAEVLPGVLEDAVQDELFSDGPDALLDLEGWGGLRRSRRRALVAEGVAEVVLPGLQRAGVDVSGGRRWVGERFGAISAGG